MKTQPHSSIANSSATSALDCVHERISDIKPGIGPITGFVSIFVALHVLAVTALPAIAGDATWNNGIASWSAAAEWTSTPASNYPKDGNAGQNWNADVGGGSASLDAEDITIQQLVLSAGEVTGAFNLTTSGLLTWSGGTMSGAGITTANGGILMDNGFPILDERTLNNPSGKTATMSNAGILYMSNASILNNAGTFLAQGTQDGWGIFDNSGGGIFNNSGTFTRNTGTGGFLISSGIVFNNSGTTNVQLGTLNLQGGDNGSTTGDFNISSGAVLNFASNFSLAASCDVAGAGTVDFSSGTIGVNGSITSTARISGAAVTFNTNNLSISSLELASGTLDGSGNVAASGLLTWSNGTMSGAGITTANGGILMDNGFPILDERTLNNPSGKTATMSNAGILYMSNASILNNAGTFLAQGTQDGWGIFDNSGGGIFNNSGTFTRNIGTGGFLISSGIVFNNTGTINVQTGTLSLHGGDNGSTTGDFNVSSGATLNFGSNFSLAASSDVAGAGTVDFSGGTIDVNGTYNITGASKFTGATVNFNSAIASLSSGPLEVSAGAANFTTNNLAVSTLTQTAGTLDGTGTITASGLLTWTGGTMSGAGVTTANGGILMDNAFPILDERTLNNPSGKTATMSNDGILYMSNASILNNAGTFLAQGTQDGWGFFDSSGGGIFNNSGTFTRNTGTGGFLISSGIVFNNTGTTNVQTGTLSLQGGDNGSTTGDFNVSSAATLNFASNFSLAASADVAGAGTVDFSGGIIDVNGTYNVTGASKFTGATVNFNSAIASLSSGPLEVSAGAANFTTNNLAVSTLTQTGGTLDGSGTITASGLLTWSGGTMSGAGVTTANGGILMDNAFPILDERTLNNPSGKTATMSNDGILYMSNASILNNAGTFLAQGTQDGWGIFDSSGGGIFNNSGTFTRNTGTGAFLISSGIVFNNTGTTNVQTGTLDLQSATVTQYSGIALTAGIWTVGSSSGLILPLSDSGVVTNQADITLSGSGSSIIAGASSSTLESTLAANSGSLRLLAGRNYTSTAGLFANSGNLQLGGGTFSNASGLTNSASGQIFGFGTITPRPTNSGIIRSAGGTLAFSNGILAGSGTVQIDAGSTLNLSTGASSGSSADFLIHNGSTAGSLVLGAKTFSVGIDYTNANFGSGNSFVPRANVSGAGAIQAVGGTGQTLGGNVSSGTTTTPVMAFGSRHVGDVTTLNYQINNTGTSGARLRGAIQTNVNGGNLTDPRLSGAGVTAGNFGAILPATNTGNLPVTFTASSAGALSGQVVRLLNNFDNVQNQTLSITGSAYRYAVPSAYSPATIAFGNVHVGAAPSQVLTLSNQAANDGFSESLNASIGSATGGVTTNGGSFTALAPGSSNNSSLSVGISTATGGSKNGNATISLTSNGTGSSGLGLTVLTPQTVTVTGSVYRLAQPSIPGGTSVAFGTVHVGELAQQTVTVNNTAANDGFSESLNGSFSANTGNLTGSGSFSALAPGASSGAPKVTLDTSTTGAKSGTSTLALVSNGTGSSGLGNTALSSQVISATGQVNNYATLVYSKDSGPATFSGSGSAYTVNFGRLTIGETPQAVTLRLTNNAVAPSDTVAGSFVITAPDFTLTGFDSFSNLASGQSKTSLTVALQTDSLGTFSQTITLNALGQNNSGYSGALGPVVLTLTGEVAPVPALLIQLTSSNVVLSWPLAEQGWILKKGNNLTAWATVTDPVVDTATEHTVTTPRGVDPRMFFRLQK